MSTIFGAVPRPRQGYECNHEAKHRWTWSQHRLVRTLNLPRGTEQNSVEKKIMIIDSTAITLYMWHGRKPEEPTVAAPR